MCEESIGDFQRRLSSFGEESAVGSASTSKLGIFLSELIIEVNEYVCDGISTEDCVNIGHSDVFKNLMEVHSRGCRFVNQLSAEYSASNVDNCVVCNLICDEFLYLSAEFFECVKQIEISLRGNENNLNSLQIVGNVARMHGALKDEVLSLKQLTINGTLVASDSMSSHAVSLSAYQQYPDSELFNQFQDTFQTEIADLRQVMEDLVRVKSPLDFNPYRDAIFATTVGSKFNGQERAVALQYLDQSASVQAKQMFQQVAEQHAADPNSVSEELMLYYLYQNKRIDLAGALTCAIDHVVDRTIDKHLDQPASYFVGQMIVFTGVTIPGSDRGFTGEIVDCQKLANKSLSFTLRDVQGRVFTARLSTPYRNRGTLKLDLIFHVTRELGKYLLDHSTSDVDAFDIALRPGQTEGASGVPDFIVSGHYLSLRKHQIKGLADLYGSFMNAVRASFGRPVQVVHELTCTSKDGCVSSTVQLNVTQREKTFLLVKTQETYHGNLYSQTAPQQKSVCLGYLDKYQVEYRSYVLSNIDVPTAHILLKKKRIDPNELRFRKMEELHHLKGELLSYFKEPDSKPHLHSVVSRLVGSELAFTTATVDQLTGWLATLPQKAQAMFHRLITLCVDLTIDHSAMVTECAHEAVMLNLLDSRSMSLSALEIMSRLTVAHEYLKELVDKDLILFVGETGAGKSTTLNYFAGNKLLVNDSGPVRVVNVDPSDVHSASCAVIGTSMISSETTFVRGFKVLNRERRFWQSNASGGRIDFENLLMCDLPGFHDTRGQGYDLSAALSIARAVKHARSIKGVVLVIPYGSVFLERGNAFIDAFANLEEMFADGFAGLTAEEINSIYLVISQSRDPDSDKLKFGQMIDEFCAETLAILARSKGTDDTVRKRLEIWSLVQNMQVNNNLVFVNVCNAFQRTQFLATCAVSNGSNQVSKSKFSEVFERGTHQKAFSDCLQRSLSIWHKLLLQRYLEDVPASIAKCGALLEKKKTEAQDLGESNRALVASTQSRKDTISNYQMRLRELNSLAVGNDSSGNLGADIRHELEAVENHGLNAKLIEATELSERLVVLTAQVTDKRHEVHQAEEALAVVARQVQLSLARVATLSAGNVVQNLFQIDPSTIDSELVLGTYKPGALEAIHAQVRAPTAADYETGGYTRHRQGSYKGLVWQTVFLAKEYRLVPQGNAQQLETFYNRGRVDVSGADGVNRFWMASIRGHNCRIVDDALYRPQAAPGGKSMVYTIEMTYEGDDRPLPWFCIEHNMPCIDMNYAEIEGEQDKITVLRRTIGTRQRELVELHTELHGICNQLDNAREKRVNIEMAVSSLRVEQFKDNMPKLIGNYETLISEQEIEIDCNEIDITTNAAKLIACEQSAAECSVEIGRLEAEKICLALVIKRNLHMARCVRDFAVEACDSGSDTALAIRKRSDLSKGSLGTLRMQCGEYISYFEAQVDNLVSLCDADLSGTNPLLDLLATSCGGHLDNSQLPGLEENDDHDLEAVDDENVMQTDELLCTETSESREMDLSRHALVCGVLQGDWCSLPMLLGTESDLLDVVGEFLNSNVPVAMSVAATNAGQLSRKQLIEGANERGYNCHPVAGVGNCFVAALHHQLKYNLNRVDAEGLQEVEAALAGRDQSISGDARAKHALQWLQRLQRHSRPAGFVRCCDCLERKCCNSDRQ